MRSYHARLEELGEQRQQGNEQSEESDGRVTKKRKADSDYASPGESVEETIISKEYLKTLDPKLAPYPFDKREGWRKLTSYIDSTTLEDVLGYNEAGDARCDALMASLSDEAEAAAVAKREGDNENKKMVWGKPRPEEEAVDVMDEDVRVKRESVLRFPAIDLKKSWRTGATGGGAEQGQQG